MGWIKRNLFFVVGGILAVTLLGGAGYFIWTGWARNSEASNNLNERYGKLQEIAKSPLQPGNEKVNNTKIAQEQEKQMRDWIARANKFFRPIPSVPDGNVTSKTYATALGTTIYQLQQTAKEDSVSLPPQYYFSFQVQSSKLTISSASLEPLAAQLGEVKAIAEILFAARINALDSIQRVRVSEDDVAGLASDYIEQQATTNELAIVTPYVINFRTFTPELARVVSGFATSPYPFIVKSITAQPASAATGAGAPGEIAPNPYGGPGPFDPRGGMPGRIRDRYAPQPTLAPDQPLPSAAGRGGPQTVLKEQLLHVTLEVEIVKLLPKS